MRECKQATTLLQEQAQQTRPLMPFGQFKGTPLDQLPHDYLLWLSGLNDLRPPLLGHVLREMGRRLAERHRQPEKRETVHG